MLRCLAPAALAFDQGDFAAVSAPAEESAALFQALGEPTGLAIAQLRLAFVCAPEPQRARELLDSALRNARATGDPWLIGLALFVAAQTALFGAGDAEIARGYLSEGLPALQAS